MKISIIGGGISGLSIAYILKQKSLKNNLNLNIKVFEKENKIGGTISTENKNGFLIESGPNGFLNSKESTKKLISSLNLNSKILISNDLSSKRYIYSREKFYLLSNNPLKFFLSNLLSPLGKLRLILEIFITKSNNQKDESVANFVKRRLGKEALEKLIGPMISGIYAGDPEKLSIYSAFPRIKEIENKYNSLIRGMIKLKKGGSPPGKLTSFYNGMQDLIDELEKNLEKEIVKNFKVKSFFKDGEKWIISNDKEKYETDIIIFAIPSYELKEIFPKISSLCDKIKYAPIDVLYLGFKNENINFKEKNSFGFLKSLENSNKILGAIFNSSIFLNRSPKNYSLFTIMSGGILNENILNLTEEESMNISLNEFKRIIKTNKDPDFLSFKRHKRAIPQYDLNFISLKNEIESILNKEKGLFLLGNAFYGVGVNDSTKRSYELSEEIIKYIKTYEN